MDEPLIPWTRLATFIRQHTHDVRNHLNSLDLEASLLSELVTSDEAKATVDRVRRQVRNFANEMRSLSAKFADPASGRAPVPASMLFLIWQDQLATLDPKPEVEWTQEVGEEKVTVDPEAIARAFRELLANAVHFGKGKTLTAEATAANGRVNFTLREPKEEPIDPTAWGQMPLTSTRRGGYGLGLWNLGRSVAASQGTVQRKFDAEKKQLVTTLSFPAP
jgi:signal transduction histidine kinase